MKPRAQCLPLRLYTQTINFCAMSADTQTLEATERGDFPEISQEVFAKIGKVLNDLKGFNLDIYKDKCIRRRIGIRVRKTHCSSAEDYAELLTRDQAEPDRLLRVLTIHVSQFFRNPPTFEVLRTQILPRLLYRHALTGQGRLRIWSVGCAAGEEPYSLALLLKRDFASQLATVDVTILATDVDQESLDLGREGMYREERLIELPREERDRWFTREGGKFKLAQEIMDMVTFRHGDLSDTANFPASDLILCRNVLIYLERSHQVKVLAGFAGALGEGGILVLGKAETLVGAARSCFQTICPVERIYKAVPAPPEEVRAPLASNLADHLLSL